MGQDRFSCDLEDEEDRVFEAFLVRMRLDSTTLGRMSNSDIWALRASALSSRNDFPIPTTDRRYLYHGTSVARLAAISARGLLLGDASRSRWTKDVGIGTWSYGKVFVADTVRAAIFYAREASRTRPVLLRLSAADLPDRLPDPKEAQGSYYVEREVGPDLVEAWSRGRWKKLASPSNRVDHVVPTPPMR
jgi:hypothetical protein